MYQVASSSSSLYGFSFNPFRYHRVSNQLFYCLPRFILPVQQLFRKTCSTICYTWKLSRCRIKNRNTASGKVLTLGRDNIKVIHISIVVYTLCFLLHRIIRKSVEPSLFLKWRILFHGLYIIFVSLISLPSARTHISTRNTVCRVEIPSLCRYSCRNKR